MNAWLTFRLAFRALLANKLRTLLTMLGIIIGVASVIAMLSIGNGARSLIDKRIQGMGTNAVFVWPGNKPGRNRGAAGSESQLRVSDWQAVSRMPEVALAAPVVFSSGGLVAGANSWETAILGSTPDFLQQRNWGVAQGRMFNEAEIASAENVALLGVEVKKELFGASEAVGQAVRIKNLPFTVIGVLQEKGSSGFGSEDNRVVMPYTTVLKKFSSDKDQLSFLALSAYSDAGVRQLERAVVQVLNLRHGIDAPELTEEEQEDDQLEIGFQAFNQAEAAAKADESSKIFTALLGGIASISLLVGGIGIMNIMLVSVTERTREIGIRMAVGARGRDVLGQFLMESILLALVGGFIGIACGYGLCRLIAKMAGWPPIMTFQSVLLAVGTSAIIGVVFGFFPAFSASRLDPIQALRHE